MGGGLMSEPKPFASLSSGLLARKGAAKPAMRPQGFGQMGMGVEDLGWNDMGYAPPAPAHDYQDELPERVPSKISALTPAPRASDGPDAADGADLPPPPVVEQQRAIEASFAADEVDIADEPPVQVPMRKPQARKPADVVSLPARPRESAGWLLRSFASAAISRNSG